MNIVGVGYTIYLGSEHEAVMLHQAAQIVVDAHQHGLITVLWIYPRGKAVHNERDADIIAGSAGIGASLGADFVKINPPQATSSEQSSQLLTQATLAAGNTGVICSGGKKIDTHQFLEQLHQQLHIGNTAGCAVGRNVHQLPLPQAQQLCKAIAALVYEDADVRTAQNIVEKR